MVLACNFKFLFSLVAKYLEHTKITEILNTYLHILSTDINYAVFVVDDLKDY